MGRRERGGMGWREKRVGGGWVWRVTDAIVLSVRESFFRPDPTACHNHPCVRVGK